jgi:lysophospholipase L1-like esterase
MNSALLRETLPAIAICALCWGGYTYLFWAMGRARFWEFSIRKFERADRVNPPRPSCIVFTGSSSINFWRTLADDMKPLDVLNRGFGGSQIAHVNKFADRIVTPYRPRAVVLYGGENDLCWGRWSKTPEELLADFDQFVRIVRAQVPEAWIYFVSIKPSPRRRARWDAFVAANKLIEKACRTQDRLEFIDVYEPMFDANGKVRRELFGRDRLHLNAQGYALWTSIIKPVLIRRFGSPAS